ncbi:MAG: AAA family ATPase [Planctomycetaceae bacterium]
MSPFALPPSPPLWNPRDCSEMAVVVRREPIDPARPELGSRPVPSPENWIRNGRIRPGDLVAVVGEAASGKTTVLCDWMARISTGDPFPGDPEHFRREPGEVLLFNSGDTYADTLQARLLLGGPPWVHPLIEATSLFVASLILDGVYGVLGQSASSAM